MPKPNYAFEKRQRELAKKKKKEEKLEEKAQRKATQGRPDEGDGSVAAGDAGAMPPAGAGPGSDSAAG